MGRVVQIVMFIVILYFFIDGGMIYFIGNPEKNNLGILQEYHFKDAQKSAEIQSGNTRIYVYQNHGTQLFIAYVKSHVFHLYSIRSKFTTQKKIFQTLVQEPYYNKLINVDNGHIPVDTLRNNEKIFYWIFTPMLIYFILFLGTKIRNAKNENS